MNTSIRIRASGMAAAGAIALAAASSGVATELAVSARQENTYVHGLAIEEPLSFSSVSEELGSEHFLHLAVDPTNPSRLFSATGNGELLASLDQGRTWDAFGSDLRDAGAGDAAE